MLSIVEPLCIPMPHVKLGQIAWLFFVKLWRKQQQSTNFSVAIFVFRYRRHFKSNTIILGSFKNQKTCLCTKERLFFCYWQQGLLYILWWDISFFMYYSSYILGPASLHELAISQAGKSNNTIQRISKITTKHYKSRLPEVLPKDTNILRDISNLPSRTPLCLAARPNDEEINGIARINTMLSNFIVTYFFKLLAHKFRNILYQEFLLIWWKVKEVENNSSNIAKAYIIIHIFLLSYQIRIQVALSQYVVAFIGPC